MHWIILAVVVGLALALWFFVFRKKGSIAPRAEINKTIVAAERIQAPGIDPTTGDPPPAPPQPPAPPPYPNAPSPTRPSVVNVAKAIRPSSVMQHIPVIGPAIVSSTLKPAQLANSAFTKVNDVAAKSLEHIPVAGSTLAAPAKAVSSVAKTLTSWL